MEKRKSRILEISLILIFLFACQIFLNTPDTYINNQDGIKKSEVSPITSNSIAKVVRSSEIVDANRDKIADSLALLIDGDVRTIEDSPNVLSKDGKKVKVTICVNKEPDDALIEKLRDYGAEIRSVYRNLIYAVTAILPVDKVTSVASDKEVTLIEKEANSKAHLDTSTVNMGVRGSSYVWDATPAIKGNPDYAIAILDTGVDSTHPDLANLIHFRDFSDEGYPNGTTGYDYGHHGSHCASIAAGTGAADTNPETVNQTISSKFTSSVATYWTTQWFEVKDNSNNPSTSVTLNWDNSGGGSAYFGIMYGGSDIVSSGPYTTTPLTHNLGNVGAGWYQVVVAPYYAVTCNKDYTITITHESNYTLNTEPTNAPVFSGVAPQSKIVSLKILDDTGSGTGTWLLNALTWISNNGKSNDYNITTVSMSIGFNGIYSNIDTAVNNLVEEGFICVASAGNDGTNYGNNAVDSPGTAQKCITVGAVNDAFEITYYSSNGDNTHKKPDVVAPGGTLALSDSGSIHNLILASDSNYGEDSNSMSDIVANDYVGMQGTSMSCPHVAGLAQLVIDAIVKTEGSWTWSEANALKVKQLICMGTWEVDAGETIDWDYDATPQEPPLNRIGRDVVEGFGMVRADAAIQAITDPTTGPFSNEEFYLDRRSGSYANDSKVLLFSLDAEAGLTYDFTLNVPSTGDFDLIIYDNDYKSSRGTPVVFDSSINSGNGVDESLEFEPTEDGIYYWSVRAAQGYGLCQVSMSCVVADFTANATYIEPGQYIEFTFTGTFGDLPATYIWDFGDGSPYSYERNPIHQYNTPGLYDVYLVVFDDDSDYDSKFVEGYILVEGYYDGYWYNSPLIINDLDPTKNWSKTASEKDWCSGDGNITHPYIIENLIIDAHDSGNCLEIWNSDAYFFIQDCEFLNSENTGNGAGIYLNNVQNGTIQDNYFSSHGDNGISLVGSHYNYLYENYIWFPKSGGQSGVNLTDSNNNTLTGNLIYLNLEGMNGISLYESNGTFISHNTIVYCSNAGVFLGTDCYYTTAIYNRIQYNDIGIDINGNKSLIYYNYFIDNIDNAQVSGSSNVWDNGAIGNYWDDYLGADTDPKDGIGDDPYVINAKNQDNYPICDEDPPEIKINKPEANQKCGKTPPEYNVEVKDFYLLDMWYKINSGPSEYFWENCTLDKALWETEWEATEDGDIITITFYAIDEFGHQSSESVDVIKKVPSTEDNGGGGDGGGEESPAQEPPEAFTLDHDATDPDTDGTFMLNWTESVGADKYSIYTHSSDITEINTSVNAVAHGITDLNHTISGLNNGTYYYIVVAFNEAGNTLSNCVEVNVQVPPEPEDGIDIPPDIPFGNFYLIFIALGIALVFIHEKRKLNH